MQIFAMFHRSRLIPTLVTIIIIATSMALPLVADTLVAAPQLHPSPIIAEAVNTNVTYYVNAESGSDGNSGLSASKAFRTLNHTVSKTNPGDTVLVMDGTYIGAPGTKATLHITRSGTPNAWITYKPYPGHSPTIQSNGGAFQTVRIDANYIIFDGFHVRGNRDQISFEEATEAFEAFKAGFGYNPRVHGTGITLSHFNIVRNNEVHNFGAGGISVKDADSVIVENNLVYDAGHYSPYGHSGISVVRPQSLEPVSATMDGTDYEIIVRGNISHSNYNYFPCGCVDFLAVTDGNGIIIDQAEDYQGRTLVSNNLAFNNGGSGIHAYWTRNVDIVNNTAFKNGQHPEREGEIYARVSENVNIINNIMVAIPGQRITIPNAEGNNITYASNIYFDGSSSPRIPTGLGVDDIIANPLFRRTNLNLDRADFRPQSNSPAIDNGSDAFPLSEDIRGIARELGSVDRGAYEVTNLSSAVSYDSNCGPLSQEAENAELFGNMVSKQDINASGGAYVQAPEGTGYKGPRNQTHRVEFCFTITANGLYRILGTGRGQGGKSDSFYIRVNDEPSEGYLWYIENNSQYTEQVIKDNSTGSPIAVYLTKGSHKVSVFQREDGARLDALRLQQIDATAASDNSCTGLVQEAEDAQISGNFVVGTSLAADGGLYIHAPEGSGSLGSGPTEGEQATFCFGVPIAGDYSIEGGVYALDGRSDSFYVQVEGAPSDGILWSIDRNELYLTDYVPNENGDNPATFSLDAGIHEVTIFIREDGARLDWLGLVRQDQVSAANLHMLPDNLDGKTYLPSIIGQ